MKSFLQDILDYNFEMNKDLIVKCIENEDHLSSKSMKLFSHVLNAQEIWNARIEKRDPSYGVWDIHVLPAWTEINRMNFTNSSGILEKKSLSQVIEYVNSRGEKFQNSVSDILFHICNHSNYHRAQIASEFVAVGLEPLKSDYILYKRRS